MLILKDRNTTMPELYPVVKRKLATVKDAGWVEVDGFRLRDNIDYIYQTGFQEALGTCDADVMFSGGEASSGKEQPYDALIVTPFGMRKMGDLKVGDTICGADGGMQQVLRIYEQGTKDVYKFTFIDGATCEAGLCHLWNIRKMKQTSKKAFLHRLKSDEDWRVWDTQKIIEYLEGSTKNHIAIPLSDPIHFTNPAKLPIDPYILGCLIGDGCLTGSNAITFTNIDDFIINEFRRAGYKMTLVNDGRNNNYRVVKDGLEDNLKLLKLYGSRSENKFIPSRYKLATIEERLAIIQGLMDTDGYNQRGVSGVGFSSASKTLAQDVQDIIWSLGGMATLFTKKAGYKDVDGEYKICLDTNVLYIQTQDNRKLFRLQRKIEGVKVRRFPKTRRLMSVEKVGKKQCRCIMVTNPNSLYLTEKSCIVTHNTFLLLMEAMRGLGRFGYSGIIIKKELVEVKTGGGILADAKRIYNGIDGVQFSSSENPTFEFPEWSSTIQLTHMNLQGESQMTDAQEKMKNKQASIICIDELTNFNFKIWKYWFSRNRDSSGMRPKMICTLNANGWHWSRRMLDWYIGDDNYIIPERIGVKRYFIIQGETVEDIEWGNSKEELIERLDIKMTSEMEAAGLDPSHLIKSFTFIPGNLMDNRILTYNTQGGNVANLYQLGEAERMKLMYSYWGEMEEGQSLVTRSQIKDLFSNPQSEDKTPYLSIDIGDGGDASRCWVWKGNTAIKIETNYSDDAKEKIEWIKWLMVKYGVPSGNVVVDATGGGNYIDDYLKGVVGLVMNTIPIRETDEEGNVLKFEQYVCLRDQLMGKLCSLIDSQLLSIAIDPNIVFDHGRKGVKKDTLIDILISQSDCLKRLRKDSGKYYFVSKLIFKKSRGESPDDLDCLILRMVYFLNATLKKEKEEELTIADYMSLWD